MKRRNTLIGAGTLAAAALGIGSATSAPGLLRDDSGGRVTPTHPKPGVFDYGDQHALGRVTWTARPDSPRAVAMQLQWNDEAPAFARLTDPEGREAATLTDAPVGGSTPLAFNVPFRAGAWSLSAEVGGQYTTFDLPLAPRLEFGSYGLDRDELVVSVTNPTHTPTWWQSLNVQAGTGTRTWDVTERLMPGDGATFVVGYPYDVYRDVTVQVYDELQSYSVTVDLV